MISTKKKREPRTIPFIASCEIWINDRFIETFELKKRLAYSENDVKGLLKYHAQIKHGRTLYIGEKNNLRNFKIELLN